MMTDDKTKTGRHQRLKDMYLEELLRQDDNRRERIKWTRYYENDQFTSAQKSMLAARGQSAVSYNGVKPIIDWLKGTERRGRVDFTVAPRIDSPEARESAAAKQEVLKWLDYTNQTGHERSLASDQAFVTGLGWLEIAPRQDEQGSKVVAMAEDWRNMLHDSRALSRDGDDARFLFRSKVVDLDVAIAIFPKKKLELEHVAQRGSGERMLGMWSGASNMIVGDAVATSEGAADVFAGSDLFSTRDRVMLLEAWTREPVKRKDKHFGGIVDPVSWSIHCTILTSEDILVESESPFAHGRFPFVPIWCYRSLETGLPYSPVRDLVDIQDSLNARIMRTHHLAHSNQLHIEKSAVDNTAMTLWQIERELKDPNGIAVFADGALAGNRVREAKHNGDVQQLMQMAQLDMDSMNRLSGITPENREQTSQTASGKAIMAKADQGSLLTTEIFDSLLRARWLEGVLTLSLVEQYMLDERAVPVSGASGNRKFKQVNQWDGQRFINDVGGPKAEFIVGEQQWKQSNSMAAFDSLMGVLGQLAGPSPEVVVALLDVVFEMNPNLPLKDKVLKRIRSVTGQQDEDAEVDPQQQAAMQQQQQMQQAQSKAQMDMLLAQVRESQAKSEKLDAETVTKKLEGLYMAAQGAQVLVMSPSITTVADELMKSAGFKDMGGVGVINPAAMPQQAVSMEHVPPVQQMDGGMTGIETPMADGVQPGLM
ncbi:MAG: hypothetical protein PHH40_04910 [Candidatus Moranbacteria bacterium]|nr:hypothetical protein [Candidatus Moranbacteria bacterium]